MKKLLLAIGFVALAEAALAQGDLPAFQPFQGQPGKDVVWVPTPPTLVEKMLDMAAVTPKDYVIDLGSGDGRNVIAAAKRGAQALGVEYNPEMVTLSRRAAAAEGVSDKAKFLQGDMFEADISRATVLPLFLLPDNLRRLTPKFLDLAPGTRIVINGFMIPGWDPDEAGVAYGDCDAWCNAYLYIVPAQVAGTWRLPKGDVEFEQEYRALSGKLFGEGGTTLPVASGEIKGDRIRFIIGLDEYTGRVRGGTMSGEVSGSVSGRWTATRR